MRYRSFNLKTPIICDSPELPKAKFKVCSIVAKFVFVTLMLLNQFSSGVYPCITKNIERLQGVPSAPHVASYPML